MRKTGVSHREEKELTSLEIFPTYLLCTSLNFILLSTTFS